MICVLSGMKINTPESVCRQLVGAIFKLMCLGVIFDRDLNNRQLILWIFLIPNTIHV